MTEAQRAVKVLLQHPHHRDIAPVEVLNGSDEMLKLMHQGFGQVSAQQDTVSQQPAPVEYPTETTTETTAGDIVFGERIDRAYRPNPSKE